MKATFRVSGGGRRALTLICAIAAAPALASWWGGAAPDAGHAPSVEVAAPAGPPVPSAEAATANPGAAVYGQFCAACHLATGQGVPGAFPPLTDPKVVGGDARYLVRITLYGLAGQTTVAGQTYQTPMSGYAQSMTDAQISQVLTYIRSDWGNHAAAVSPDVVKAERARPGTPQENYQSYPK